MTESKKKLGWVRWLGTVLGSYALAMVCLAFLFWLTYWGTRIQAHMTLREATEKYFWSWGLLQDTGVPVFGKNIQIPLPGGMTLMLVLGVNLLVGGLLRLGGRLVHRLRAAGKNHPSREYWMVAGLQIAGSLMAMGLLGTLMWWGARVLSPDYGDPATPRWLSLGLLIATSGCFAWATSIRRRSKVPDAGFKIMTQSGGVYVAHIGIIVMLLGGLVQFTASEDGHISLYESQFEGRVPGLVRDDKFYHYYDWEVVVTELRKDGGTEYLFDQSMFEPARDGGEVVLKADKLPFDLIVERAFQNCRPRRAAGVPPIDAVGGWYLEEQDPEYQLEADIAGAYVRVADTDAGSQRGALWGLHLAGYETIAPWTVTKGGVDYAVQLRKRRMEMPLTMELIQFRKEDHPGTGRARVFSSDVRITDETGVARDVHITMNRPFRDHGFVIYQTGFGPGNARPGTPLYSTLVIQSNPADGVPWWSVAIIGVGLLWHFMAKLILFTVWVASKLRPVERKRKEVYV